MKPIAAAALAAFFIACSTQAEHAQAPAQPVQAEPATPVIEHISPMRDTVGGVPKRFEWTAVQGAGSYQFELWTEYDTIVYRQRGIATTSTEFPSGETLDPGTYWWSVFAIRNGEPFASSGLAAFVVQD